MIRYSLVCEAGHGFESWFPSSDSYDTQVERGLVTCPVCDSAKVSKALMVPSVARTDRARAPAPPAKAEAEAPVTMVAEPERQLRAMPSTSARAFPKRRAGSITGRPRAVRSMARRPPRRRAR